MDGWLQQPGGMVDRFGSFCGVFEGVIGWALSIVIHLCSSWWDTGRGVWDRIGRAVLVGARRWAKPLNPYQNQSSLTIYFTLLTSSPESRRGYHIPFGAHFVIFLHRHLRNAALQSTRPPYPKPASSLSHEAIPNPFSRL